jgi:hypothetical protein
MALRTGKGEERVRLGKVKFALNLTLVILPLLYLAFILADRAGVWDRLSGLDLVEEVAARFELSYAPNASAPVRLGDKEWEPLLKLVCKYSHAQFPADKQPRVIARYKALISAKIPEEGPVIAEWTSPSTPLYLLYRDWPGNEVPREDYRIIGTIGNLREWISEAKDYRRFLVQDVFLGTFTPLLGFAVLLIDRKTEEKRKS